MHNFILLDSEYKIHRSVCINTCNTLSCSSYKVSHIHYSHPMLDTYTLITNVNTNYFFMRACVFVFLSQVSMGNLTKGWVTYPLTKYITMKITIVVPFVWMLIAQFNNISKSKSKWKNICFFFAVDYLNVITLRSSVISLSLFYLIFMFKRAAFCPRSTFWPIAP